MLWMSSEQCGWTTRIQFYRLPQSLQQKFKVDAVSCWLNQNPHALRLNPPRKYVKLSSRNSCTGHTLEQAKPVLRFLRCKNSFEFTTSTCFCSLQSCTKRLLAHFVAYANSALKSFTTIHLTTAVRWSTFVCINFAIRSIYLFWLAISTANTEHCVCFECRCMALKSINPIE